jgi:hypothetical protein
MPLRNPSSAAAFVEAASFLGDFFMNVSIKIDAFKGLMNTERYADSYLSIYKCI